MQIRIALPDDVTEMFRVRLSVNDNKMTQEALSAHGITHQSLPAMLIDQGRGWVAENEQKIVAFAMANATESTIFALFVEPDFEGRGIGRQLMIAAEQWLAEMGCSQIWLETDSNLDVRANGFYHYLGWIEEGIQADGQTKFIKCL
ncbi:GNAT family N-acetyltransferase [Budviciaceae bacterium BWR-B9]|uniref:GNAT family N-acetyltransferase n=1 Tax=Limnobaculum allomyrinae TaxID=2791986 RepID=A0ABS1INA6_9GAMM|nr:MULTISPECIES: GNAT family N-acetyltransferase [Limnobaculum]MBK5143235.1 GNAT family N-acetyltransferase [Limnobaculum allomyrinae]MBV7691123.1 GNAT family N-acetyltransferase [Limnobaculum sp. M2-1]